MKKLIFMVLAILFFCPKLCSYTVKPRMTKTVAPHYSGISGRRYYFPTNDELDQDALVITIENPYGSYLNYGMAPEDVALEINRRKRVEQLQRSSVKPKGVTQQGEIAGLPEDYRAQFNALR